MGIATLRALAIASLSTLAGACAQNGLSLPTIASVMGDNSAGSSITTSATPTSAKAPSSPEQVRAELEKATEYWGAEYAKKPSDAQVAVNYARNLKAMGDKQQALGVLQSAYENNPRNKSVMSELGRLALEFDQISLAKRLLEQADDAAQPDWRVISARGTVFAKQGMFSEAIPFYERALQVSPEQPSVLNNLAMAYTMNGEADKAEPLLRKASAAPKADERVSHNLALVRSLQGQGETEQPEAEATEPKQAVQPRTKAAAASPRKPVKSAWTVDVYAQQ